MRRWEPTGWSGGPGRSEEQQIHTARFDSKYSTHIGYRFTVVEVSTPSQLVASVFLFHQT